MTYLGVPSLTHACGYEPCEPNNLAEQGCTCPHVFPWAFINITHATSEACRLDWEASDEPDATLLLGRGLNFSQSMTLLHILIFTYIHGCQILISIDTFHDQALCTQIRCHTLQYTLKTAHILLWCWLFWHFQIIDYQFTTSVSRITGDDFLHSLSPLPEPVAS